MWTCFIQRKLVSVRSTRVESYAFPEEEEKESMSGQSFSKYFFVI